MARVTIMGLGAMGSRMARQLMDAGHNVTVWNRSPGPREALAAAGALSAATPAEACADAEFALAMVRDDEASRAVWTDELTGALTRLPVDAVAIECSTLSVAWVRELAEACTAQRVPLVDAPSVGSRPQAEAGQLIFLAGGAADTVEHVTPLLEAMGTAVHHAGPSGAGAAVKLLVNSLFAIQIAALAELHGLATRLGLDPGRAMEILGATPAASPAARAAAELIVAKNHAPLFPVELGEKDLGYTVSAASESGAELPVTGAVRELFERARAAGLGGDNLTGIAKLFD